MAQTYTTKANLTKGNSKVKIVDVTADAAYPDGGGYALTSTGFNQLMGFGKGYSPEGLEHRAHGLVRVRDEPCRVLALARFGPTPS
jgi:hypothetical protein